MPVGRAKPNRRGGGDLSSLLDWTLKTDASGGFALGDTAVLYNGGMLESLRAPVSRSAALYLTPTDNSTPDIRALPIR
jgi:hypothetical protein